jgi:hypothetical protein
VQQRSRLRDKAQESEQGLMPEAEHHRRHGCSL